MTNEVVGIIIFSGFMLCLVGLLIGNLFLALYKERKLRKLPREAQDGPAED
jgi:hypothetical protein